MKIFKLIGVIFIALLLQAVLFIIVPLFSVIFFPEAPQKKKIEAAPVSLTYQVEPVKPKPLQQEIQKITPDKINTNSRPTRESNFSMNLNLAAGSSSQGGVKVGGPSGVQGVFYSSGEVDQEARPLNEVFPDYPLRAEREGIKGRVVLLIKIDRRGKVVSTKVQSVNPTGFGFEEAALKAIQKTKFQPAEKEGVPVAQKRIKEFVFDY